MLKTLVWIKRASELPPHIRDLMHLDQTCLAGEVWEGRLWPAFFKQRKALALKVEGGFILFNLTLDEAENRKLAVSPEKRRHGLASALFTESLQILKQENIEKVFLEVREANLAARSLYEGLGFVEIGKRKEYYKKPVDNAVTYQFILPTVE